MQWCVAKLSTARDGRSKISLNASLHAVEGGFDLHVAGRIVLQHRRSCPAVVIARGNPQIAMDRGNFLIEDIPSEELVLDEATLYEGGYLLGRSGVSRATLTISDNAVTVATLDPAFDRMTINFHAEPGETVWGGGEQMSYLALNGRRFPMWTSEPGVGRDKSTALTQVMDAAGMVAAISGPPITHSRPS